ncbi:MBL fold metallo-hydrolase [Afifella pfennigii]|uniref:MBL fold metallo-hydrolase n=1 Tax=Afifella pfennigii TaxID=209897 RepID=UPI0004797E1C|nr:MBL fold metallo-hydrolase [Afifella pfennigii]
MSAPEFNLALEGAPGETVRLSPLVRRVLAPNPGPFTYRGTCTYIVGEGDVAVIDPGPADAAHLSALRHAVRDERVSHILVTHTHPDHYPAAAPLAEATGAAILGCAPGSDAASRAVGAASDAPYRPDRILACGERIEGPGYTLTALATPGHAANHLCFELQEERALFSGDHVMAWSTSVVIPPDGDMGDYMASLRLLLERDDRLYWPGHGGPVKAPKRFVRALLQHRRQREAAILGTLGPEPRSIDDIVLQIYQGISPSLLEAAAQSTLAHLIDLAARGKVRSDTGDVTRKARFLRP